MRHLQDPELLFARKTGIELGWRIAAHHQIQFARPVAARALNRQCIVALYGATRQARECRQLDALRAGLLLNIKRRSEEHTSELQSLMRISYAVFCLKKKKKTRPNHIHNTQQQTFNHLTYSNQQH